MTNYIKIYDSYNTMIKITPIAQEYFIKLLEQQKDGTQIRMFVNNPGKFNAECGLSFCYPDSIQDEDSKFNFKSFSIYIDKISLPYLKNTTIDFHTDKFGSKIILNTPNIKIKKPNKNASLTEQINYFIHTQINPKLASHSGHISLIKITKEMEIILQFNGGCNGCSMVELTLKEGIEKEIIKNFPSIKKISDITEHHRGPHSYY